MYPIEFYGLKQKMGCLEFRVSFNEENIFQDFCKGLMM